MHIAVVGTGYVGLVSAACFADLGHDVVGVDIDEAKIEKLKRGQSPIYEPGLEEVLKRNLMSGRLRFTTDIAEALPHVTVVFCAVATPTNEDFSSDLKAVFAVAESIGKLAEHDLVFVNKSTVPVGTGKKCEAHIAELVKERRLKLHIPVVSNPEFLREGLAIQDTLQPDRIVVGMNPSTGSGQAGDERAKEIMEELYHSVTRTGKPILFMSRESAELVKYASNAFLATKISFINMFSELCEATGANVRSVAAGMGLDSRIGPRFLHAGIGYGGSCFPKDVKALIALSRETGIMLPIVNATHEINEHQRKRFFRKLLKVLPKNATVGVWGLSFKPRTDDLREAPSLDLIALLQKHHCVVQVHDPVAMENMKRIYPDVTYCMTPLEAAEDADAVIVLTEWDVFRGVDLKALKAAMRGKHLFDGRNIYEPDEVTEAGLQYVGIGVGA